MEFQFTPNQQHAFNDYYSSLQAELHSLFGDDITASVRRLGLIPFRIAMVLTARRCHDTGELGSTFLYDDEDLQNAMPSIASSSSTPSACTRNSPAQSSPSPLPRAPSAKNSSSPASLECSPRRPSRSWPPASTSPSPRPSATLAAGASRESSFESNKVTTKKHNNENPYRQRPQGQHPPANALRTASSGSTNTHVKSLPP